MQTWIALIRGINVGGNNILPMQDLREILSGLGFKNVRTYIQSGNCVFQSSIIDPEKLAEEIATGIEMQFGFLPHVFILTLDGLNAAMAANPYPQASDDPRNLHFNFLSEPVHNVDLGSLEAYRKDSESFTLTEAVLYLYAPEGIGRSRLAARIPKLIPVPMTGRNLKSILKIAELANSINEGG